MSILRLENCFDVSVSNVNKDALATQKSRERYRFCNTFSGLDEYRLWTKTGFSGIPERHRGHQGLFTTIYNSGLTNRSYPVRKLLDHVLSLAVTRDSPVSLASVTRDAVLYL